MRNALVFDSQEEEVRVPAPARRDPRAGSRPPWRPVLLVAGLCVVVLGLVAATRVPAPHNATAGETFWMPMDDHSSSAWVDDVSASNQQRKLAVGTTASHTTSTAITGGAALAFSGGAGDYLVLAAGSNAPSAELLRNATAADRDFTIAFWMKANYRNLYQVPFFLLEHGAAPVRYLAADTYGTNNQNLEVFVVPPSGAGIYDSLDRSVWDGQWLHYAAVRSGTTFTLYRNAVSKGANTDAGNSAAFYLSGDRFSWFVLGADYAGYNGAKVVFDDFRVYSRALTAAEVGALYNSGSGRALPLAR